MRSARAFRSEVGRLAADGLTVEEIATVCDAAPKQAFEALQFVAYRIVHVALADGSLVRPDRCSACGTGGRIEGHHADYFRALEVEWLCYHCHRSRHRGPRRKWVDPRPAPVVRAPEPSPFSRPEEVASRLGVPVKTVRRWARTTDMPCVWVGSRSPRFRMSQVDQWAARGGQTAEPEAAQRAG